MLMRKKEEPETKQAEDDDEDLQDNYKEDKPPEKTPEPTTKPIWRPPASRQQTKSLTENFPCDLRESWCELRMYVCSTGDDFLSERTAIMNALLPELQVRCASRRIRISAIDCWSSTGLNYFAVLCFFRPLRASKAASHSQSRIPFTSSLRFQSQVLFKNVLTLATSSEDPDNADIFDRFREIDRCAIFIAFCGRRFGDPISDDTFPPKLRLLSPHDVFLQELFDSVNEAAFTNSKAVPLVSMYVAFFCAHAQPAASPHPSFSHLASQGTPPKSSTAYCGGP